MKRASHFLWYSSINNSSVYSIRSKLVIVDTERLVTKIQIRLFERAYYSVFATNKRKTRFLNAYLLLSKNRSRTDICHF